MLPLASLSGRRVLSSVPAKFLLPALLLSLLQLSLVSSYAQETDEAIQSDEVVRVRTDLVTIPLTVTDGRGRRVAGLRQSDFQVTRGGAPVEIRHFSSGADEVALLFLLDASGSTREIITHQREAALALFSRFGPRSRVAVMGFREHPEITAPFTRDIRLARAGFQLTAIPNSRTAIFNAARAAVRAFQASGARPTERRIVVLISDGLDTASSAAASAVAAEALDAGVSFYVLHLPLYEPRDGRLVPRRPARGFRELAEKTGGQYFVVGDARSSLDPRAEYDLRPVFRAVAEDLEGQYVLGFYAGEPGGGEDQSNRTTIRPEVRLASRAKDGLRLHVLRTYDAPRR